MLKDRNAVLTCTTGPSEELQGHTTVLTREATSSTLLWQIAKELLLLGQLQLQLPPSLPLITVVLLTEVDRASLPVSCPIVPMSPAGGLRLHMHIPVWHFPLHLTQTFFPTSQAVK